ncbi:MULTISPECIES: DUF2599 domain-containing protein [unclassified Agrococcus]|uniref:DUF2599 domain-containing protein n=1 Tax=unclassified Agrococcus TaxID=2615065 RepID=UPI003607A3D9
MIRFSKLVASPVGIVTLTLAASVLPGSTPPPVDIGVEAAVRAVSGEELTIVEDAAPMREERDGEGFVSVTESGSVSIPEHPEEGISIAHAGGTIEVGLPAAERADEVDSTTSGLLAYDNDDGSYTVPIPGQQGDLQLNTVIESASAPTEYAYQLELPADVRVETERSAYAFLDAEGALVLMVAPPWARDAAGRLVPTHYDYAEGVLTHVVEHSADFDYPIVADPWLGVQLFGSWGTGTHLRQPMYSAWVTSQAVATLGAPSLLPMGVATSHTLWLSVMGSAGWREWTRRWPSLADKPSLRQQYDCHIHAGIAGLPFTRAYNLERSRPNRGTGGWASGVMRHRCNWAYATGTATN